MKKELITVITKMSNLLIECKFQDKSDWMTERLNIIKKHKETEKEFIIAVKEIQNVLAGMGSFMDLPLIPPKDSKLTENEIRKLQWDLVEEFDKALEK